MIEIRTFNLQIYMAVLSRRIVQLEKVTIGVLSDTHISSKNKVIPKVVLDAFKDVDLIIHAGDLLRDYVVYELEELAPVHAVAGNNDDSFIRDRFGRKKIISIGDVHIGIVHGDGYGGNALINAIKAFENDTVNCVVFGHSHAPCNEVINKVLFFNPGSPTDRRFQPHYSYGIIQVTQKGVSGQVLYF